MEGKGYCTRLSHWVSVSTAGVDVGWLCCVSQEGAGIKGKGYCTPLSQEVSAKAVSVDVKQLFPCPSRSCVRNAEVFVH